MMMMIIKALTSDTNHHSHRSQSSGCRHPASHNPGRSRSGYPIRLGSGVRKWQEEERLRGQHKVLQEVLFTLNPSPSQVSLLPGSCLGPQSSPEGDPVLCPFELKCSRRIQGHGLLCKGTTIMEYPPAHYPPQAHCF